MTKKSIFGDVPEKTPEIEELFRRQLEAYSNMMKSIEEERKDRDPAEKCL